MKEQEINNMIEIIGCDRDEFLKIIEGYDKVNMSSGGNYSDFYIFASTKLIAKYDYKGNLIK